MEKVGRIAFYVGLVVAIIAGFMNLGTWGNAALVGLGIIVGLLNITSKETGRFLLATVALIIAGIALKDSFGMTVGKILVAYIAFTSAAALIVALKEVYSIQKFR